MTFKTDLAAAGLTTRPGTSTDIQVLREIQVVYAGPLKGAMDFVRRELALMRRRIAQERTKPTEPRKRKKLVRVVADGCVIKRGPDGLPSSMLVGPTKKPAKQKKAQKKAKKIVAKRERIRCYAHLTEADKQFLKRFRPNLPLGAALGEAVTALRRAQPTVPKG